MASAAARPSKATFGRLLAVIAALAFAVLLLHAAHSDAAHRKLTEPRAGLAVHGEVAAFGGAAVQQPGVGGALDSGSSASVQPVLLDPSSLSRPAVDDSLPVSQGLPRRRLRLLRVVLLIQWE